MENKKLKEYAEENNEISIEKVKFTFTPISDELDKFLSQPVDDTDNFDL